MSQDPKAIPLSPTASFAAEPPTRSGEGTDPDRAVSSMEAFLGLGTPTSDDPAPAAAGGPSPVPQVPGYEILGELGRGGMGVVYRARDVRLDRTVALKMILTPAAPRSEQLARFRAEARAVAQLEHPGIVQIYEVGEYQGRPFFALQYVAGGGLAGRIRGRPWAARPAARLVADLAAAVQHAHERGVIHRDLKPANVLLSDDGTPKIGDFGLAKRLHADTAGLTISGAVLGSPAYMPPEQADGHPEVVGPGTDVFGLGAILYELLTGRPPYRGDDLNTLLAQARQGHVTPPRQLNPQVPRGLERVCCKALAADPARRHASAAELQRDLRRWLGRPRRIALAAGAVVAASLVLVAVLVALAVGRLGKAPAGPAATAPTPGDVAEGPALTGELIVTVGEDGAKHWRRVDRTGTLPVRTGEGVHIEVRLNQVGYVYLLAVDERGEVAPLYPWPWGREPKPTLAEPPPPAVPLDTAHSPPELDKGWRLEGEGMQTILLLARRTPLPPERNLAAVLGRPAPAPLGPDLREVLVRGFDGGRSVEPLDLHRRVGVEKVQMDDALTQLLERLRQDFETIRAVRFALKSN